MAFLQVEFFSNVLGKCMSMNVLLPQTAAGHIGVDSKEVSTTYQTLYLLHGKSDNHSIWMRLTSIERYARERGIAVVMPNGDLSFYSDMAHGGNYLKYIAEELPAICRDFFPRMSAKREDNFIAGLSMGGYGALKCALSYPDTFSYAASLSGVLDIQTFCNETYPENRKVLAADFADLEHVAGTENDILYLAEKLKESGAPLPSIFLWCGTEDGLYPMHETGVNVFSHLGYDLTHKSSPGSHNWSCWDEHIQEVLDWLPIK